MLEENGTRALPHRATIAHLQGGQCGNQIGNTCCDRMGSEHNLEANDQLKGKAEEGGWARSTCTTGRHTMRYAWWIWSRASWT